MATPAEKIHTQVLTNASLTIVQGWGIRTVSLLLVSGVGEFSGTLQMGPYSSMPIALQIGVPIKINSESAYPLDGVLIDCSAGGVIDIMGRE